MNVVSIRVSKDGGRVWSDARLIPMGEVGDFLHRVVARRWGSARHWVFEVAVSDPVKADLIAASIQMENA